MISIIIPTFREEKVIENTLQKLKESLNGFPDAYEIIVSDGGSPDKTVSLAEKYADKVVVEPEPERRNIARGRNLGAAAAEGDYLAFLDADIAMFRPDRFWEKAVDNFLREPKLVALGSRIRVIPQMETRSDRFFRGMHNTYNIFMNNVLHQGAVGGEFMMVKTAAFRRIGGFNEHIVASEDLDLFLRLSKIGRTRIDPSLTVYEEGRRAHATGWIRLMAIWIANGTAVMFSRRSVSKKWKDIR